MALFCVIQYSVLPVNFGLSGQPHRMETLLPDLSAFSTYDHEGLYFVTLERFVKHLPIPAPPL